MSSFERRGSGVIGDLDLGDGVIEFRDADGRWDWEGDHIVLGRRGEEGG
jgi:hypothetical protein